MPTVLQTTTFIVFFMACIFSHHEIDAQLFAASDTPGPISAFLQLVWEPSSLIRMWTALDQLYNIALGWRAAAKQVVQLPFRQGRALEPHVKIQEPRRYKLQKKQSSDMPHWDWFKKVYEQGASDTGAQELMDTDGSHRHNLQMSAQHSINDLVYDGSLLKQYLNALRGKVHNVNNPVSSNFFSDSRGNVQSPLVGLVPNDNFLPFLNPAVHNSLNGRAVDINTLLSLQQLPIAPGVGNSNRVQMGVPFPRMLPPPFAFQPQEVFSDFNMIEFPKKEGGFRRTVQVPSTPGSTGLKIPDNEQYRRNQPFHSNVPLMFLNNGVPNSNPETRLRMFLKLMGKLGEIHKKSVKAVEFDDDSSPDIVKNE